MSLRTHDLKPRFVGIDDYGEITALCAFLDLSADDPDCVLAASFQRIDFRTLQGFTGLAAIVGQLTTTIINTELKYVTFTYDGRVYHLSTCVKLEEADKAALSVRNRPIGLEIGHSNLSERKGITGLCRRHPTIRLEYRKSGEFYTIPKDSVFNCNRIGVRGERAGRWAWRACGWGTG